MFYVTLMIKGMNNKYNRISGIVFIAASLLFAACNNDNDIDGTLERVDLLSEITIEKTAYHTGDQSMCMLPGQEIQLNCIIGSPEAQNRNYVWTSSNSEVASVSSQGYLVTKAAGETVLSVTPEIGFGPQSATPAIVLKVVDNFTYIESISVEDEEIEKLANDGIWQNATYQVNVKSLPDNSTFKKYKWASSDEAILTVSQEGLLTGIGEGTATVTVTADDFNSNPVVYSFSVKVKKAVEITDFSFLTEGADVELLSELGYGQEIDLNSIQIIEFTPGDATSNLLQWSSSDDNVVSVTEEGLLKVNTTTGGSVEITATYNGISKSRTVTVAEGRLWYSFGEGIAPWSLESGNKSSVFESKDGRTTINMGAQNGGKYRGDLVFVRNGGSQTKITPSVYRYLAIKLDIKSALISTKNTNGCVKLELWNNSDPRIIGDQYMGDVNNANNSFKVLGKDAFESGLNVIYYDLQSKYNKTTPTDWNQTFTIDQLKFVIADYPADVKQYDIYWARSFKTIEELEAFVAGEE